MFLVKLFILDLKNKDYKTNNNGFFCILLTSQLGIFFLFLDWEKKDCHPINIIDFPNIFILKAPHNLIFSLKIKIIVCHVQVFESIYTL